MTENDLNNLKKLSSGLKKNERIKISIQEGTIKKQDGSFSDGSILIFTKIPETKLDKFMHQAKKIYSAISKTKESKEMIHAENENLLNNIRKNFAGIEKTRVMNTLSVSISARNFSEAIDINKIHVHADSI